MIIKKFAAALTAAVLLAGAVSCGEKNNVAPDIGRDGVSELVKPDEKSEEGRLGNYRFSENGTKLYYDDDFFAPDVILTMEKYFNSFANDDFDAYNDLVYPDYAERYNEYLNSEYNYSMDGSFELRRDNLRETMKNQVLFASTEDKGFTGDFKVTRIKIEPVELSADSSEEELFQSFFEGYNDIFGIDYFDLIKNDADDIIIFSFYVFAEGEDGKEYALVNGTQAEQGPKIILAKKDGKYYTFG